MSGSFACASKQTNKYDGFNSVSSQSDESHQDQKTDTRRANQTKSPTNNQTKVGAKRPINEDQDLAREESSQIMGAQDASNELKEPAFVNMSSLTLETVTRNEIQDRDGSTNDKFITIEDPPKANASRSLATIQEEPNEVYNGHEQDSNEKAEETGHATGLANDSTENKQIEYDDDAQANDTSTSASVNNQLVDLESLADSDPDLDRRTGQQGNLFAGLGLPLTGELRRLRLSGVKKVQQALRSNRRRRRRKPSAHHKKRETTSLPMALIKSMQTRQGLINVGLNSGTSNGGIRSTHNLFHSSGATSSPLIKQLSAANPLKQQLASGSMQISTAFQRLLAGKFGASLSNSPSGANNHTQTALATNKLMLHNDNHLLGSLDDDEASVVGGADYSATSATSGANASEQLNNLLAASQQDGPHSPSGHSLADHTGNQHAHYLTNMQNHRHLRRPHSPSLGAFEDDAAPALHRGHSLADYQSSASSQADRLAELMSQWGGQQQELDANLHSPTNAGNQQDETLKLSQLVAAATAAASGPSRQSTPSTATNKQLIPIEIIGLDPSVTSSILYGPVGQHGQRPMKEAELLDEPSAGGTVGPAAATELDVQENPLHFQAPAPPRHQRNQIDQSLTFADNSQTGADHASEPSGEQPTEEAQASRDKVSRQKPSSVLHIHHFHHTQPAASGVAEQQSPANSAAANSDNGQPEIGAEQQLANESGKGAEGSQTKEEVVGQRLRPSQALKTQTTSEAARVVLLSGAGSGSAQTQEDLQGDPKLVSSWSSEAGESQSQTGNHIEGSTGGEIENEAGNIVGPATVNPKKMRFITRHSLRQRQQQAQIEQPSYQNITHANSHLQNGAYDPSSQFSNEQQQIIVNNQLQQPIISRPYNQRRPSGYSVMLSHPPAPPSFNNPLNSSSEQIDAQQALSDVPDSQGMLMVAYRPTGTLVPIDTAGQILAPLYDYNQSFNRSFAPVASGQHSTYIRQTPYNEGSESKTPGQLLLQRPQPSSAQLLLRSQMSTNHGTSSSNTVPSPNLFNNLMKHPKMNQALLMHQLHASNQSASPYWSNEDERLLTKFNLANEAGQLKIAQASLIQDLNSSLDRYPNQFIDNKSLMSRLNHSHQLLQRLQLAPGPDQGNSSQRLTSEEQTQVVSEQAAKQLQYQNQIKQQQQAQVASLLLNNLASGGAAVSSPLLSKIVSYSGNTTSNDGARLVQANDGSKNNRFELTMASDRSPSKLPVSRNASMSNNNVRVTKHFHAPDTSLHDNDTRKAAENNLEQQAKVHSSSGSLENSVQVQTSTPKDTVHQVVVENILDPANGLGNIALGFIFFISLMSFILILASLIYRRRRVIGSARCGPSTMRRDDDADSNSHPKEGTHQSGGRKSLRYLNNLTQRTKHLMRSNFSANSSTSNVIAGSTPLSSLKSLNQLDSSITSDSQNHHTQADQDDHRSAATKVMEMASPQAVNRRTNHLLESRNERRYGWEPRDSRASERARPSKYLCPNQDSSVGQAKMSTFNVSNRQTNAAHHPRIDKYSTPDGSDRIISGVCPDSDIRTLNTRLQKNAYLHKALAASPLKSNHQHIRSSISSKLGLPAHQPSKQLGKKHQQYNRASPASIEMPSGSQAKYVNTQVQLKNANL